MVQSKLKKKSFQKLKHIIKDLFRERVFISNISPFNSPIWPQKSERYFMVDYCGSVVPPDKGPIINIIEITGSIQSSADIYFVIIYLAHKLFNTNFHRLSAIVCLQP